MDTEIWLDEELMMTAFELEQVNQRLDEFHDYLDPTWFTIEAKACELRTRLDELELVRLELQRALGRTAPRSN